MPFPPCVSRQPPPPDNSCTLSLPIALFFFYPLLPFPDPKSLTAVVPLHTRPLLTTVETMTSFSLKNNFEWIHSSLECDN